MINAGELKHRIIIQYMQLTQDLELNPVKTWVDLRTVWAAILPKTSREYYKFQTMNPEITEIFKIRYTVGITAHQRIKWGTRYYEIIGEPINVNEENTELIITCKG